MPCVGAALPDENVGKYIRLALDPGLISRGFEAGVDELFMFKGILNPRSRCEAGYTFFMKLDMTRRMWLWGFVLGGVTRASGAATSTCPATINRFQCLFNLWSKMVWSHTDPNIIDAQEIATWVSVRHEWRELEKVINKGYGI